MSPQGKKGTSFVLERSLFYKKTQQRLIIRIGPKSANNERSSILFSKFRENKRQHTLPTLLTPRKQEQPGNRRTAIAPEFRSFHRPTEASKEELHKHAGSNSLLLQRQGEAADGTIRERQ